MAVDADLFRRVMGSFASGVTIVTTLDAAGRPRGFTASGMSSLSLDPRLLLVCVNTNSATLTAIQARQAFVVNILAEAQRELAQRFASRLEAAKFNGISWQPGTTGLPVLEGALAHAECQVFRIYEGGDHVIILGEVVAAAAGDAVPLLYFRGRYGVYHGGIASVLGSAEDWEIW
ncbi:MAG TPA: flavin reductase family protein [Chloroflexia bacterium]|nr:flavin reductase family protein [Chloroflexia bacterium]